jgi:hypothetical protein
MTPDQFRAVGHRLIDWIADYRGRVAQFPVMARTEPGQVKAMLPTSPPEAQMLVHPDHGGIDPGGLSRFPTVKNFTSWLGLSPRAAPVASPPDCQRVGAELRRMEISRLKGALPAGPVLGQERAKHCEGRYAGELPQRPVAASSWRSVDAGLGAS